MSQRSLEAGSAGPICYLATSYCRGGSLAQLLSKRMVSDEGPLDTKESAALIKGVAEAVHHAHERGVLHRDLKPANIVFDPDADATTNEFRLAKEARLVDFGLAKSADADSQYTRTGASLGTPDYASPEQSTSNEVGPATDIFSLGAILYELITGEPPFRRASAIETLIAVREHEPVPPRRLVVRCPKDLEAICLKCLEKDPAHRYVSAVLLASDLQRFLNGETVLARRPHPTVRLVRWCKRYPWAAIFGAMVMCLAVAGPLVAVRQNRLYREAQQARVDASRSSYFSDMNLAYQDWYSANLERCGDLLLRHIPEPGEQDYRAFEWFHLYGLWKVATDVPVITQLANIESMAVSRDGSMVAVGSQEGFVLLWDRVKSRAIAQWKADQYKIFHLEFSHDDRTLATAMIDRSIKIWDVATQQELAAFDGNRVVACAPSDATIAFVDPELDGLCVLKPGEATPTAVPHAHEEFVWDIAFSPDGTTLATTGMDAKLKLWNVETLELLHESTAEHSPWCVVWAPNGRFLATGDTFGNIQVWDSQGTPVRKIAAHNGNIRALCFASDSQTLGSASEDNTIRLWDSETGSEKATLPGHRGEVVGIAFVDDDKTLLTSSIDGDVHSWDLTQNESPNELVHPTGPNGVAVSPDCRIVATTCVDDHVRIFDLGTGEVLNDFVAHKGASWRCAFLDFEGRPAVASTGDEGYLRVWDPASSELLFEIPCALGGGDPVPFAVHPIKPWIAFEDTDDASACIWDWKDDCRVARYDYGGVAAIQFSPDGSKLAMVTEAHHIRLIDLQNGEQLGHQQSHTRSIMRLAFSPDSRHLATGSHDRSIRTWNVSPKGELEEQHHMTGPSGFVDALAYSPDGRVLASAGGDHVVRIWDTETGRQRAVLNGHKAAIYDVAFSADGQTLLSASGDSDVRIWRAPR